MFLAMPRATQSSSCEMGTMPPGGGEVERDCMGRRRCTAGMPARDAKVGYAHRQTPSACCRVPRRAHCHPDIDFGVRRMLEGYELFPCRNQTLA